MRTPLRVYTEPHILRGQGLDPIDLRLDPGSQVDVTRPEGPGYVRFEDLYQIGDSVTDAFDRMTAPAIVTFPEDIFYLHGFPYHGGAIDCRKGLVRGIVGSGSGKIHDDSAGGTIFELVEGSSSIKPGDPQAPTQAMGGTTQLWLIRNVDNLGGATYRNFQLRGSDQGHNFHGLNVFLPVGPIHISNVKVSGVTGSNGAPPGETFGISAYAGSTESVLIEHCEVDGRRSGETGMVSHSAAGLTVGRSIGATIRNCRTHHNGAASMVTYRAFDVTIEDCYMGNPGPLTHTEEPSLRGWAANHEEGDGLVHRNCTYAGSSVNPTVHVSHSNTDRSYDIGGVTRSAVDGSLEVINPVYSDIRSNRYFYITSWTTGVDGTVNNDSMVTPPTVTGPEGDPLAYVWAHGGNTIINPEYPATDDSIL